MKKISLMFSVFLAANVLLGQMALHFGVSNKSRFDFMHQNISNNELISNPYSFDDYYWVVSLGMSYNRFLFTLQYSNEDYKVGYRLKETYEYWNGYHQFRDSGKNFGLSGSYYLFDVNKKINILPGIGITYFYSSSYGSPYFVGGDRLSEYDFNNGVKIDEFIFDDYRIDAGKYPYHIFLKPQIEFQYSPTYFLSLFIKTGFNIGFREIGRVRAWYQINENPKMDVDNSYFGNYLFIELGGKVNFKIGK